MLEIPSTSEAVAILCLLMVGADNEVRMEEVNAMLNNPFFVEHVRNNIGPHQQFLKRFNQAKAETGEEALEKRAIKALKSAFPAFQLKTLAMLTLIAGADDEYDQREKELMARIASKLGVAMGDVEPELAKMKETILSQAIHENGNEKDSSATDPQ